MVKVEAEPAALECFVRAIVSEVPRDGLNGEGVDAGAKVRGGLVRESDDLQATKVIAMSGKLTDGQASHLMNNGFDGYLKKPFHVRSVIEAVEDAVAIVY